MSKVIVLGMDGASPDLMAAWIEQGLLPNLARLCQTGVFVPLRSVPNLRSAAAWSSFITGLNPGKHGIFEFYERTSDKNGIRFTRATERKGPSFWQILCEQGKRVIVMNVPMTYPAEKVNGCFIAGLDAPGISSPGFTHPDQLLSDLENTLGPYIQEPGVNSLVMAGKEQEALDKIKFSVRQRGKYARALLMNYEWDTSVIVFRETDPAQHCFWHHMESENDTFKDAICEVYQEIDAEIGSILSVIHEEHTVVVLSDHGFGFRQHGNGCLNSWLAQSGYLTFKGQKVTHQTSNILKIGYQFLEKSLSRKVKEKMFARIPGLINKIQSKIFFPSIEWEKTLAYADNIMPVIWINQDALHSKSSENVQEYNTIVQELQHDLLENFLDADTGQPVIDAVSHRDDIYTGPCADKAPDLLIHWKHDSKISRAMYGPERDPILPNYPTREFSVISGDHRAYGVFIASGPGINTKSRLESELNIIDVPSIITYLNGLPVPEHMEGQLPLDLFTSDFLVLLLLQFKPCPAENDTPQNDALSMIDGGDEAL